ncbi:MAG: carboxypeptidase-like regulatory domain-containing protein, partial [Bacteroidaceae bacterium]|nr:carboxypeptidase-like regulatory domain-containing protein [Bacteroidaceae bacterium]
MTTVAAMGQTSSVKVTGKVIDETNQPMIGVTVVVKGTSIGTTTDLNGNFSLSIPKSTKELLFSYIGYKSSQVAIPANHIIDYQMKSESQLLNDVVVIGYGTQRKSDLTGSVSNVNSKEFNQGLI